MQAKYIAPGGRVLNDMTADDAQAILKTLAELEFSGTYGFSMIMAILTVSRHMNIVSSY